MQIHRAVESPTGLFPWAGPTSQPLVTNMTARPGLHGKSCASNFGTCAAGRKRLWPTSRFRPVRNKTRLAKERALCARLTASSNPAVARQICIMSVERTNISFDVTTYFQAALCFALIMPSLSIAHRIRRANTIFHLKCAIEHPHQFII